MCEKCQKQTFEHLKEIERQKHILEQIKYYFYKADEQLKIYTSKEKHDEFSAKRYELYMNEYNRWTNKI